MNPFKVWCIATGIGVAIGASTLVIADQLGAFEGWPGWLSWLLWMAMGALAGEVGQHFEDRATGRSTADRESPP